MLMHTPLPPPVPGLEVLVSSQGMSQGLLQSEGPQLFARAFVRLGPTQFGGQWRNVSSTSANGVAALFVRHERIIGGVTSDLAARYRIRTGFSGTGKRTAWEFSAGFRKQLKTLELRANTEFSLDDFGGGKSFFAEFGPSWEWRKGNRISAAIGHRLVAGPGDYTSMNLGFSRTVHPKLTLDARVYATDRGELGPRYRQRVIVSAKLVL